MAGPSPLTEPIAFLYVQLHIPARSPRECPAGESDNNNNNNTTTNNNNNRTVIISWLVDRTLWLTHWTTSYSCFPCAKPLAYFPWEIVSESAKTTSAAEHERRQNRYVHHAHPFRPRPKQASHHRRPGGDRHVIGSFPLEVRGDGISQLSAGYLERAIVS